jgi:hypothetical protein
MYLPLVLLVALALVILFQFLAVVMFVQRFVINLVTLAFLLAEAAWRGLRFLYRLIAPMLPGILRVFCKIILIQVYLPDRIMEFAGVYMTQGSRVDATPDMAQRARVDPTTEMIGNVMQQCAGFRKDKERCTHKQRRPDGKTEAQEVFYCWQHKP